MLLQDFNTLGLGLDDLIEAYLQVRRPPPQPQQQQQAVGDRGQGWSSLPSSPSQTALAVIAIDRMCASLLRPGDGAFDLQRFRTLNADDVLVEVRRKLTTAWLHGPSHAACL